MNGDAVTWRIDVTPNGNRELVLETINNAPLLKWLLEHGDQFEHCLEVTDEPMYPKEHLMPPPVVYNNAILIESSDEDEEGALNFKSLPPKPPKMPQEPTSVTETIPVEAKRTVTLAVSAKAAEPPKVSKKLTLELEPRSKPIATTAATAKTSKAKASSSSSSSSVPVPKVKAEPKKVAPKAAAKATKSTAATKGAGALDADEFYYDPPSPSQAKPRRTRPVKPSSALDEMATVDFAVKAVLSTPPKSLAVGGAGSAAPPPDVSASAVTATACKRESGAAVGELLSALTSAAKAASPVSTATAADAKPTRPASSRWRSAKSTPPPFATERRPDDTSLPHTPPADDDGDGDSDDDAAFWDTYRRQLLRFPSPAQRQAPTSARPPVDVYPRDIGGIAVTKQGTVYGKGHRLEPLCDSTALYFRQRNAAALYRRFQEQGYLVIRRLLPPGYVLAARRRIIRILRAQQFLANVKAPLPTLDAAGPARDDGSAATKKRPLGSDAPGAAAKKPAMRLATTLQLDASSDEDDAASADDATGDAGRSDDSDAELRADASLISEDEDDAEEERYGHTVLHRQGLIVHVDDSGVITGSARYAATLALDSDSDDGGARSDARSGAVSAAASAIGADDGDDNGDDDPREWRSVRRSASVNRVVQNAQVRRLLRFLAVGKTLCDEDLYHQTLAALRDADRDAAAAPPSMAPPPRLGPVRHSARLFHPQFTWLRVKAPMECTPEHADGIFFLEHTDMYAANPKLPGGSCLLCVDGASGRLLGGDARRAPGGDEAAPVCQLCRSHSCAKSAALHAQLIAAARATAPPAPKPTSRRPPAATLLYLSSSSSGGDSSGDEAGAPATYNTRHSARSETTASSTTTPAAASQSTAASAAPAAPPQLFLRCDDCHRCFHVDCLPLAAVREGHITHHYLQAAEEAGAAKMAASHPNVHGLARHQLPADDWHCPDCLPRPTLATCWVPLERALPLSQGTLVLLPHSHQRIRFFHRYQRSYQVPQSYTKDTRQLNWHFPPRGFRAGDVVVFDARLMHGSTRNYTSQFRMSLDFRWMLLPHRDGGGDAVGKRPRKPAVKWSLSSPRPAWRPATTVHPTATERFVLANTTELRADV